MSPHVPSETNCWLPRALLARCEDLAQRARCAAEARRRPHRCGIAGTIVHVIEMLTTRHACSGACGAAPQISRMVKEGMFHSETNFDLVCRGVAFEAVRNINSAPSRHLIRPQLVISALAVAFPSSCASASPSPAAGYARSHGGQRFPGQPRPHSLHRRRGVASPVHAGALAARAV